MIYKYVLRKYEVRNSEWVVFKGDALLDPNAIQVASCPTEFYAQKVVAALNFYEEMASRLRKENM